jgi:hypothetical protein
MTTGQLGDFHLPGSTFANTEIYPWELRWLSITGPQVTVLESPFSTLLGGVNRRFRMNVGMSGEGDFNIVNLCGQAMCGPSEVQLAHDANMNVGARFGFDPVRPYSLPRDGGLVCEVKNDSADENAEYPGVCFMGYEEVNGYRNPVHLAAALSSAGQGQFFLAPGTDTTLNVADLRNNGRDPVILTDMMLDPLMEEGLLQVSQFPTLSELAWRINPSTGIEWMPDPEHIPAGCIAPFNRGNGDVADQAPRVYSMPPLTILKPKAELSVDLRFIYDAGQGAEYTSSLKVHVCLFGYLEVT